MTHIKIFKIAILAACFLSSNVFAMQISRQIPVPLTAPTSPGLAQKLEQLSFKYSDNYNNSDIEVEVKYQEEVDINAKNSQGHNALMLAAYCGHLRIVELLIKNDIELEDKDNEGRTALMIAAYQDHSDVIDVLLQAGAEINTQDELGWTALMLATMQGHTKTVRFLLELQADTDLTNKNGKKALDIAADKKQFEILTLIRENALKNALKNALENALIVAACNDRVDDIDSLLQKGVNIDARNLSGWTALMLATARGHVETIKFLLKNNADASLVNKDNESALDIAGYGEGGPEIIKLLSKKNG